MATQPPTPEHTTTPGPRSLRVNVSMTPDRLARVDAYAASKGWTRSAVIAKLIDRLEVVG